ncbi:MAG: hypothetical protein OEY22_10935 [Candidatus Bathyarchaeota archaeon]|nr:hypothetical protein [Candidatus Bathyarchaeota archaeon]
MSLKAKIPLMCFLVITIFSIALFSYTLYLVLEIRSAIKSLNVFISDVTADENAANFSLSFYNPSNMRLGIFFIRAWVEFNNASVGTKPKEFNFGNQLLDLPTNVQKDLMFTVDLDNSTSYTNGTWTLKMYTIFGTDLPQRTSANIVVKYGG